MSHKTQHGASMMMAIFLLVVLSALAAVMARMVGVANIGAAQGVRAAQVRQAALAGLEWGLWQWVQGGGNCATATPLSIEGFRVDVTCTTTCADASCSTASTNDGAGNPVKMARIVSTACPADSAACPDVSNPHRLGYVERRMEAYATREK